MLYFQNPKRYKLQFGIILELKLQEKTLGSFTEIAFIGGRKFSQLNLARQGWWRWRTGLEKMFISLQAGGNFPLAGQISLQCGIVSLIFLYFFPLNHKISWQGASRFAYFFQAWGSRRWWCRRVQSLWEIWILGFTLNQIITLGLQTWDWF